MQSVCDIKSVPLQPFKTINKKNEQLTSLNINN